MPTFTFRVQALGGKFLADDIGGARVVVHDAASGDVLAQGITRGDSGNLMPTSGSGAPTPAQIQTASKNLVATASGASSWWLVPDSGSSAFTTPNLDVSLPRPVRVVVTGPTGGLQSAAQVRTQLVLSPSESLGPTNSPGHVILLPGLLVQPLSPFIHDQVNPGQAIPLTAKVTMMCGCQVGSSYWPATDFTVQAIVQRITSTGLQAVATVALSLQSASTSVFSTPANSPFIIPGGSPAYYQVTFSAWQSGTGNAGSGVVNLFCG